MQTPNQNPSGENNPKKNSSLIYLKATLLSVSIAIAVYFVINIQTCNVASPTVTIYEDRKNAKEVELKEDISRMTKMKSIIIQMKETADPVTKDALTKLEGQLNGSLSEINTLQDRLKEFKTLPLDQKENLLNDIDKFFASQLGKYKNVVDFGFDKIVSYTGDIEDLNNTINEWRNRYTDLEKRYKKLEGENKMLETENSILKNKLDSAGISYETALDTQLDSIAELNVYAKKLEEENKGLAYRTAYPPYCVVSLDIKYDNTRIKNTSISLSKIRSKGFDISYVITATSSAFKYKDTLVVQVCYVTSSGKNSIIDIYKGPASSNYLIFSKHIPGQKDFGEGKYELVIRYPGLEKREPFVVDKLSLF